MFVAVLITDTNPCSTEMGNVDLAAVWRDRNPIGKGVDGKRGTNHRIGRRIAPDGSKVYVANSLSNDVSVIDTATNTLIGSPIPVGSLPIGVAITPVPLQLMRSECLGLALNDQGSAREHLGGRPCATAGHPGSGLRSGVRGRGRLA